MKKFNDILNEAINKTEVNTKIVKKNIDDEIKAYKNAKGEEEQMYYKVLITIKNGIKNYKNDTISWDFLKKRFINTSEFKNYKGKYTDESDFEHLVKD